MTLAATAVSASCARHPPVDLARTLHVTDITTGWYDAGVVEGGKNKLVPSISFRLENVGQTFDGSVQLNAVFRRLGEGEEWGSAFARGIGAEGLAAGASTAPMVLRSNLGYTGTQPRADLLQNRLFIDAQVQVFAKRGAANWTKLGDYRVDRRLLTR